MISFLAPVNAIQLIRGSSVTIQLTITNGDPTLPTAINLTGAKAILTVKEKITDPLPLIQKATDVVGEALILAPTQGIVQFFLSPLDTQDRDVKKYVFDVWIVLAGGRRFPVVSPSDFNLLASVTILR